MKRLISLILTVLLLTLGTAYAGTLMPYPKFQAFDSAGAPLVGGKVYTYITGTSTAKASYSDRACTTPNTNPVVLDADGEATIYLLGSYKIILKTAADASIWTIDGVEGMGDPSAGGYYADYNETDQGATGFGASVKAFVDTIGTDTGTIVLSHNSGGATTTYTFSTSETIPANITLKFERGAIIAIDTGITVTINGSLDVGVYQIFSGVGVVALAGGYVSEIFPEWWGGGVGGVIDNYAAFKTIAALISSGYSGSVIYQTGTYLIDQVRTAANGITDILITGGKGFILLGNNTVFEVAGDFVRTARTDATVTPLAFNGCSYFTVSGIELDGNNASITIGGQTESLYNEGGYGIQIVNSNNYTFQRMNVHNFISDGLFERGHISNSNINKNGTYISSQFNLNGRNNLTIVQAVNLTFLSCDFNEVGTTAYTYHSPGAGIDIEPTSDIATEKTGNITFINCNSLDNIRRAFIATRPSRTENVTLIGFRSNNPNDYAYPFTSLVKNISYNNCVIDTGAGDFLPAGLGGGDFTDRSSEP